jgi:hypothetical protein
MPRKKYVERNKTGRKPILDKNKKHQIKKSFRVTPDWDNRINESCESAGFKEESMLYRQALIQYWNHEIEYKRSYFRVACELVNETATNGFKLDKWQLEGKANKVILKYPDYKIKDILFDVNFTFKTLADKGKTFTAEAIEAEIIKRFPMVQG